MRLKKTVLLVSLAMIIFCGVSLSYGSDISEVAQRTIAQMPKDGWFINAEQLKERIDSGKNDFVLIDVRMPKEKYDEGHIPGAIYVPIKRAFTQEALRKLSKDKDVIIYCGTGSDQGKVLMVYRMLGYKAYALKFGFMAWKRTEATDGTLNVIKNADIKKFPVETSHE